MNPPKVSAEQVEKILSLRRHEVAVAAIARRLGISESVVYKILREARSTERGS